MHQRRWRHIGRALERVGALYSDYAQAERDILDAGEALLTRHPDVGAIVCENHNMGPYAAAMQRHLRVPIFTVYTFVTWFHAGLQPRDFGFPGAGGHTHWQER